MYIIHNNIYMYPYRNQIIKLVLILTKLLIHYLLYFLINM